MKKLRLAGLALAAVLSMQFTYAQNEPMKEKTVEVGGAPMYPSKNIVENAVNSADHTTLVAAVKTIEAKIKEGKGKVELTTVAGGKLWVMKKDGKFWLKDEKGGMASVTIGDVYQRNGVIHVIDSVVLPK